MMRHNCVCNTRSTVTSVVVLVACVCLGMIPHSEALGRGLEDESSLGGRRKGEGRGRGRGLLQADVMDANPVFRSISAGALHTCGIAKDGFGYCWGQNDGENIVWEWEYNDYGEPIDYTISIAPFPIEVSDGQLKWSSISTGGSHACGITTDRAGYCWGDNDYGQLGDGTETNRSLPGKIANGQNKWSSISTGWFYTCGITTDGSGYCWGDNEDGQIGDGTITGRSLPVEVAYGQYKWSLINAGYYHTCGITTDGSGYCWGYNYYGQIGDDGTDTDRSLPVAIANGLYKWSSIVAGAIHTCGITKDGSGYCWGHNEDGELGDGTETDRSLPVAIADGKYKWSSMSAGRFHTCGITTDRAGYCWGYNEYGQLGDGTDTDRSIPVAIATGIFKWSSIDAGWYHTCGITTTDGSGYCWGYNKDGQLLGTDQIAAYNPVKFSEGDSSNNKSSNAALIGGVVGGVVGALLLAGVGFFLYRKRRNRCSKRLGIDSSNDIGSRMDRHGSAVMAADPMQSPTPTTLNPPDPIPRA